MTWFKVDDSFYRSRKVRLLGKDRVSCVGLWTLCGDWAADNLSDGFVPWEVIEGWDSSRRWSEKLVSVGLWFETEHDGEEGIQFHDWDDWQPTKEQVVQRRKADAERRARWREARRNAGTPTERGDASPPESRKASRRDTRVSSREGSRAGSVLPDPTRPDPITTSSSPTADAVADETRSDVESLCKHLRDRIVDNGSKPPTAAHVKGWRTAARLLLDRDKRDLAEAHRLIDWCHDDTFWRSNVLSMPKFRQQYDALRLRALAEGGRHINAVPEPPRDPAAALDDLRARGDAQAAARLLPGVVWIEPPQPPDDPTPYPQWIRARAVEFIDAHADDLRAALTERKTG